MPETPNHGYNVPNEGEQDWHEPLNENFEDYDTDIEIRDEEANLNDYDPKAGAKFLSTDTGTVFLGDGGSWQSAFDLGGVESIAGVGPDGSGDVDLTSPDGDISLDFDASGNTIGLGIARPPRFRQLNPINGFLGIGRDTRITDSEVFGIQASNSGFGGMYINSADTGGEPFYGYAINGDYVAYHYWDAAEDEWTLSLPSGSLTVDDAGNLTASGNKNFAQTVETDNGKKEVVYTASEAGTPHTEASGVAELEDGRAEVDLPEHFEWVTDDKDPLMVQVTPHAGEPVRPQVTERSTDRIVVEDFSDSAGEYEVSYTVKGTREGHADKQVVREPAPDETGASSERMGAGD